MQAQWLRPHRGIHVLAALLSLATLSATPLPEEPFLSVFGGPIVGAAIVDRDVSLRSGGAPGLTMGARLGLEFTMARLFQGGGRLSLMPSLDVRHDFAAPHTDGFGAMGLGARMLDWLRIVTSVGYGLTVNPMPTPQHLLAIGMGLGAKVGPVWVTLESDVVFRLSVLDGRTLRVLLSVQYEHVTSVGREPERAE
jgi:hypothetical protein